MPPLLAAMLDYSDDDSWEPRRWKHSTASGEGGRLFRKRADGPSVGFAADSIFQGLKEKSSGGVFPKEEPPMRDAFIISEFIPKRGPKLPHELLKSEANWKDGTTCTPEEPPPNFDDHPDSFYKSMRTLVLLAQFFAVLPVSGIRGPNYNSISFKWLHYKTLFWAFTFFGTVFCFVCVALKGLDGGTFDAASGILYFACGVLSSLLMLNLTRNWKSLNNEFAQVEFKLIKYGYPKKIGLKFKVITVVVLLVAFVEHVLAKLKSLEMVLECAEYKMDFFSLAESFFLREYSEVFHIYPYSFWKGILVLTAHLLTTANWNFKDLFLAMISWTIAERFAQIHGLLDKVHGLERPVSFWREIREDYNSLSVLTKRVDSFIRKLMFLSIGNNLFFICIQLFHSLKKKVDSFRLVYFFWSFGFLVLRTGFVAFSAARINDESKEPKTILYSVPSKNYTAEVRRFLTQLTTTEVALTGSGFFSITRSLILTITGSVITYEIVLVQFGSSEMSNGLDGNGTVCFRK